MTKPTLNRGQQAAADAFMTFLMTADRTFAISGPAGVGKTFLMAHLSNEVMQKYEASCKLLEMSPEFTSVYFTATTNKAAEVLEQALGKPVQTIHSYLGLKVKENYRTGKTELQRTNNWKIRRNIILFIDECSMVDTVLYDEIMEAHENCKIVFVGDHAQMAPINESISRIYAEVAPHNIVELTEPVRNAGQPVLMALCDQLRETVETGIFRPIQEVEGVIDYLTHAEMELGLEHYFQDLNPSCRTLCYTNTRVQDYNEHIRTDVRQIPEPIRAGDVLVVAQAFARGKISLSVEHEVEVYRVGPVLQDHTYEEMFGEILEYRLLDIGRPGSGQAFAEGIPFALNREKVSQISKALAKQKLWSEFFDLKAQFIDLRDKAACTVYKAQGSTYEAVFIDLGNIGTSYQPEQVARMLYVAASRPRERIFLYGQLPSRYHNSGGKPLWTARPMSTPSFLPSCSETQTSSASALSV